MNISFSLYFLETLFIKISFEFEHQNISDFCQWKHSDKFSAPDCSEFAPWVLSKPKILTNPCSPAVPSGKKKKGQNQFITRTWSLYSHLIKTYRWDILTLFDSAVCYLNSQTNKQWSRVKMKQLIWFSHGEALQHYKWFTCTWQYSRDILWSWRENENKDFR